MFLTDTSNNIARKNLVTMRCLCNAIKPIFYTYIYFMFNIKGLLIGNFGSWIVD